MKKNKSLLACFLLSAACFMLPGCASVPAKQAQSVYNIHGTAYFPLLALCDSRNINWQYDTFTRSVTLSRDAHRISLRVGDPLVLIDGRPWQSDHPVEISQGAVVVPEKFKLEVLDKLFKNVPVTEKLTTCNLKIRRVVIDAGHGGNDPGAIGRSGLREKDVNLDIAKRLSNILRADGIETVMTRSTDRFVPLSRRAGLANDCRADLFVAIHSNANRVRSLKGFEVYYVAPSVSDTKRAIDAARNSRLFFNSSCFSGNSLDLKTTLWDMIYTSSRAESIELSRCITRAMDAGLDTRAIGVKSARFEVLKGAQMPAVLVEVGFLSNRSEELMLKNGLYRQKIAESIAEGVRDYAQGLSVMEASRR